MKEGFDGKRHHDPMQTAGRMTRALAAILAAAVMAMAASVMPSAAQMGPPPMPPADIPFPHGQPGGPGNAASPIDSDQVGLRGAPSSDASPADASLPGVSLPGGTASSTGLPADVTPYAPANQITRRPLAEPPAIAANRLELTAKLTEDGPSIRTGLVWRIFSEKPQADGSRAMIAEAKGGSASLALKPGVYYVYCGFGHSGATERVELSGGLKQETVVLNAGGLRLNAVALKDKTLPAGDLSFDIFSLEVDNQGEPKPVALDVHAGEIVRLASATYNVVASYGNANATTSADVEVKAGKLTDITLTEKAAKVTLKLVSAPGGEAIADTSWSVLTQAGDLVTTGVGAFPSFVLAEGDYTVVARHGDDQYQRVVTITTGNDTDVEVLTTADKAAAIQ